jgi:hypothetical protein
MFVGYSLYHAHDVYRMINMDIQKIVNLHDIIWLKEVHNDWIARKVENHFNDDDDIESKIHAVDENLPYLELRSLREYRTL